MAANLMAAGFRVVGYDLARAAAPRSSPGRRPGRAQRPRRGNADPPSSSPRCQHRRHCWRSRRSSAAAPPRPRIVVETSTLPIAVKAEARRLLRARGITLLDCPLSGTGAQARAKDLVVYASGERAACRRVAPSAGRVLAGTLLRGPVRRRIEDEVRRQPAGGDSQRGRGRSARACEEGGPRPGADLEGDRRRRRRVADAPGARPDDGAGATIRTRR